MKLTTISDTGIVNANCNGHWKQTLIFKNEKDEKFNISINYSSPTSELYKWSNEKGWLFVLSKDTVKDYGIDTAYRPRDKVSEKVYLPVINDLKILSKNF